MESHRHEGSGVGSAGVGDLPTGVYMTLGQVYTGDTMAAIYTARTVLMWMSPAVGAPA